MQDTITVKPIVASSLDAANFGTARDFPRVATPDKGVYARRNDILGSLSPAYLRVKHNETKSVQQSSVILEQRRARVDALQNVLSTTYNTTGLVANIPDGLTEEEFVNDLLTLSGILLENDCAVARALYRGEY